MELYLSLFMLFKAKQLKVWYNGNLFVCTTFVVQQQLQQVAEKLTNFQKCFFTAFIGNFFFYVSSSAFQVQLPTQNKYTSYSSDSLSELLQIQ